MLEPDPRAFDEGPIGQDLVQIELGLKPWPSKDAKRHHFVSRFVLNRFAQANERLFQLDCETGTPRGGIPTSKAASRMRFYEFEDDEGNKSSIIEGLFAVVERAAALALLRLEEDGEVDEVDRATISMYLAYQWVRTPAARERGEKIGEAANNGMMASRYADRSGFMAMVRELKAGDESLEFTEAEAEELRRKMLQQLKDGTGSFVDPDGGMTTSVLIESAHDMAMLIFGAMTWTLMRAGGSEFITSDTGAASFDPTPKHPWSSHTLYSSPHAETYFPISSQSCLRLTPGEPVINTLEATRKQVVEANLRIYGWANRYIYGRTQEVVAAVRRARRRKPALAAAPKPFRPVMLIPRDPDDDSIARAHSARGLPAYMTVEGEDGLPEQLDYLVVGEDGNAAEVAIRTDELLRKRELKAAGYPPDSDAELPVTQKRCVSTRAW